MQTLDFFASDLAATDRLGKILADCLPDGATVALDGPLGAGKTRLVQAVAQSCGIDRREVVSPTFVLAHHYQGHRSVHHLDAYRLPGHDEFLNLGVEEYFADDDLVFVEWADRVATCLPEERLDIRIEVASPTSRRFIITARGRRFESVVDALRAALK